MENVGEAIVVTNYYLMEGETRHGDEPILKTTPVFRNIAISHMTIDGAKTLIDIAGLPEMPIRNLHISDVMGTGKSGMTATYTDDLELHNVQLNPASGPAFSVQHSSNLELDDVTTSKPTAQSPVVQLHDTPGAVVRNCRAFKGTGVFLLAGTGEIKQIVLESNALANAATPTEESSASQPAQ